MRELHGAGVTPFGGAIALMGGSGLYPLGGRMCGQGLYPLGGARFGRTLMPFAMGMNEFGKLPMAYQMRGNGLIDSFKSAARSIVKKLPNSVKTAAVNLAKSAAAEVAPMAEAQIQRGISKLPASAQPFAQMGVSAAKKAGRVGVTRARKSVGLGVSEEPAPSPKQISFVASEAAKGTRRAPIMDKHEYNILRNVAKSKAMEGRGAKLL